MAFLTGRTSYTGDIDATAIFHIVVNEGTTVAPNWVDYKIPWVDLAGNILVFSNYTGFPTTGDPTKLYIATNQNKSYRWDDISNYYAPMDEDQGVVFTTRSALPATGIANIMYVTKDDNKCSYWDGAQYTTLSASAEALTFTITNSSGSNANALSVWNADGTLAEPDGDLARIVGVTSVALNLGLEGAVTYAGLITGVPSTYLNTGTLYLATGGSISNTVSDIMVGVKQADGDLIIGIQSNPALVTDMGTEVDALGTAVGTLDTSVSTLNTTVGTLETDLTTVEGDVVDLDTTVGALDTSVATLDKVNLTSSVDMDSVTGVLTLSAINNLNVDAGVYTLPTLAEDNVFAIAVPMEHTTPATVTTTDGMTFVDGIGSTPDTTLTVDVSVANKNLNIVYEFKVIGTTIRGAQ